ncbi:MAG: DNA alkylation repair protein [Bacillus subtilis]|nr:DNA alkylation repair protein [Bacillus subtilis]
MNAHAILSQMYQEVNRGPEDLKSAVPNRKPYIGIRFPRLVEIAKQIQKNDPIEFLKTNDYAVYELEILQTYVIGNLKEFHQALDFFQRYAIHAREWSTVDSLCQHFTIAIKHPKEVLAMLHEFAQVDDEYLQRIVAVMLLSHFFHSETIDESIELLAKLKHPGYYTRMAIAWAYATLMVNHSDACIAILKSNILDVYTHNKAIQKIQESLRIDKEQKALVKALKR